MRTIITHATSPGAASEPPLRVLLVVSDATGGIARHVEALADHLVARGHAVEVAASPGAAITPAQPQARVTTADALRMSTPRDGFAAVRLLRRTAAATDVVHAHGLRAGAAAATAVRGKPVVVTLHNAPLETGLRGWWQRAAERVAVRRSTLVLAASEDLRARAARLGARGAMLLPVVAPPRPAADSRDDAPMPATERPVALTVARLAPQKRLDVLIDAAAGWQDEPAAPEIWIVGDGPLRARLQHHAEQVGAPVRFLGARSDVDALLERADVFVLSSDWEARPLALQEAMRAGVAVVATAVGGVPDLVGDAGVLVAARDAAALREALRRVTADDGLRADLAKRASARAREWPTLDESLAAVEAVYRRVAGSER